MEIFIIADKDFNLLKNEISGGIYFYEKEKSAKIFLNNLLKENLINALETNVDELDKTTLKPIKLDDFVANVKNCIKRGKEKVTAKRANKVYAIFDEETNSYMQSFVVSNLVQAQRNLDIVKKNLKETCGDADFIKKLELRELEEKNEN